jgi:hypothetical protein
MKIVLSSMFVLAVTAAVANSQSRGGIIHISSFSNTQQSTTSTTLKNTDVVIAGSDLENGKDYLILYSAAYGANNTNNVPEVVVSYDGTVIARGSDEGSSTGNPEAMRIASLLGA